MIQSIAAQVYIAVMYIEIAYRGLISNLIGYILIDIISYYRKLTQFFHLNGHKMSYTIVDMSYIALEMFKLQNFGFNTYILPSCKAKNSESLV